MKKLIYILLATILIQTSYAEDKIKISINKDKNGKITLTSSGHSVPISFDIMGKSYDVPAGGGSVEVESKELDNKKEEAPKEEKKDEGPDLAKEETAANNEQAEKMKNILSQQEQQKESQQVKQTLQQQQNQQLSIPAVNSNPNPKEATPI
jgi:leucyl aminopeptidase (aminopeptidase T)